MKIGSIVETVGCFEHLRKIWGFNYPRKGDVLTISMILEHPNKECQNEGVVLLKFIELPDLVGVCDRKIDGQYNFKEILMPKEIEEILEHEIQKP